MLKDGLVSSLTILFLCLNVDNLKKIKYKIKLFLFVKIRCTIGKYLCTVKLKKD